MGGGYRKRGFVQKSNGLGEGVEPVSCVEGGKGGGGYSSSAIKNWRASSNNSEFGQKVLGTEMETQQGGRRTKNLNWGQERIKKGFDKKIR